MPANPKNIKQSKTVNLSGDLWSVARVPGTEELYVGGSDGKIHHVDLAADKPTPTSWSAHVTYVSALVVAGEHLISAGSDHRLSWWDRATRQTVRSLEAHAKWIHGLALSPDGQTLASVGDDMVCRMWETATGKLLRELRGHELLTRDHLHSKLYACTFTRDGKYLATADQVGDVIVWEAATGKQAAATIKAPIFCTQRRNYDHSYGGIRTLAFTPDSQLLAAGGAIGGDTSTIAGSSALVQVFDWAKAEKRHEFREGNNFFERVAFHHEGDWLLAAGGAGSGQKLVFYDLKEKKAIHELPAGMLVFDLALNETSDRIYTVGRGKGLVSWDLQG